MNDDLNYVDEDSDLSSGDDGLHNSDFESQPPVHDVHSRKRGRPKVHHQHRESKRHAISTDSSPYGHGRTYTPPPLPSGYVSDIDETGEMKVDKFGRLLDGNYGDKIS